MDMLYIMQYGDTVLQDLIQIQNLEQALLVSADGTVLASAGYMDGASARMAWLSAAHMQTAKMLLQTLHRGCLDCIVTQFQTSSAICVRIAPKLYFWTQSQWETGEEGWIDHCRRRLLDDLVYPSCRQKAFPGVAKV